MTKQPQFEQLPYKFTRDELRQLGEDLAVANQEVYTLRGEKKTAQASIESSIKNAEARAAAITRKINERSELREVEVEAVLDTPRPGLKTITRKDTAEEIRTEVMTKEDRQVTMEFTEAPAADTKTAAAGGKGDNKSRRSN